MFHAFGNNPVRYVDPDGRYDLVNDTIKCVNHLISAAKNVGDIDIARDASDFINDNPEFWGVVGVAGGVAGLGFGVYSYCPSVQSFITGCIDWIVEKNNDLLNLGIDITNLTYTCNINNESVFQINLKETSFEKLKATVSFETVLCASSSSRGNVIRFSGTCNTSKDITENYVGFTISFSFNKVYREKSFEETVSSFVF